MTFDELIAACDKPVEGLDGKSVVPEHIYFTVQKAGIPKGHKVRLAGSHGPLGNVLNVKRLKMKYAVTALFKRSEVKKWAMKARALV